MSQVLPCIRGRMGNTDYYQAVLSARTLNSIARTAKEVDPWAAQSVDERLQRDLNDKRIREEIIPYLTRSEDRLFGSLIVLIHKPDVFEYESLPDILGSKVPAAYRQDATKMGFLTIDGGDFIALDGQHRLVALRRVIQREFDEASGGKYEADVQSDDISVLFIRFENNEKTRRIFSKVNRYAKPTNRGDNILMSEDDGNSITTRRLLNEDAPLGMKDDRGGLLVNWRSNTLANSSTQFTTLSAVHETVKDILGVRPGFTEKSGVRRPSDEDLDDAFETVEEWWTLVLNGMDGYKQVLENYKLIPKLRNEASDYSLLFKPATQIALFKGLVGAHRRGISKEEVVHRANKINWRSSENPMWTEILVTVAGRMIAGRTNTDFAARVISYMVGAEKLGQPEIDSLRAEYRARRGKKESDADELPEPIK